MPGHRIIDRDDALVRRTTYDNGTVSYSWAHEDEKVTMTFAASGKLRLHHKAHLAIDRAAYGPPGTSPEGTTVELLRVQTGGPESEDLHPEQER
jgi:hypothetical protein